MHTNKQILEARELFQAAMNGNLRARAKVEETLTTSDFPILLGAAYGREIQQEYGAIDPVWQRFAKRSTVPDFRAKTLVDITGGRAALEKVREAAEYPARKASESQRSFSVDKYGARFPLTWEMVKNDDLGAFRDFPQRLATAARETEERIALLPLFNAAGTGLSSFLTPRVNSSKDLNRANLNAAFMDIAQRKDADGRPVIVTQPILLIPTALAQVAADIVSVISNQNPTTGDIRSGNGLIYTPEIVVDPWLDIVGAGYTSNAKTWYLLPGPQTSVKPALTVAFLAGEEQPDLRVKNDQGTAIGGGSISPEQGSFDDDTIQYRVRHIAGGAGLYDDAVYVGVGA
jgi:hypothetical protein